MGRMTAYRDHANRGHPAIIGRFDLRSLTAVDAGCGDREADFLMTNYPQKIDEAI